MANNSDHNANRTTCTAQHAAKHDPGRGAGRRGRVGVAAAVAAGLAVAAWGAVLRAGPPTTGPAATQGAAQGAAPATTASAKAATEPAKPVVKEVVKGPVRVAVQGRQFDMIAQQRQQLENSKRAYAAMTVTGTYPMDNLVHLSLMDGMLRADTSVAAFPVGGQVRVKVEGVPGADKAIWMVMAQNIGGAWGGRGLYVNIFRYDFDQDQDDQFWLTSMNINSGQVSLSAQGIGRNVWFQQANGRVFLNMNNNRDPAQSKNWQAASLTELAASHPDEVRQFLLPILTRMGAGDALKPGPADVYAVLKEVPADPKVLESIRGLLPRLDADAYSVRDAASRDLSQMGAEGVLGVLRMDLGNLTEEQRGRLSAFVAGQSRRSREDLAGSDRDVFFLCDCLDGDDRRVRVAAKQRLEALVRHPLAYDVDLPKDRRPSAIDALRKSIKDAQDKGDKDKADKDKADKDEKGKPN